MRTFSIEQLADEANKILNSSASVDNSDKRYATDISVRRIRDYMTKGIVSKPLKNGRDTYFNEDHLEELLNVRNLQSQGISDTVMQKLGTSYDNSKYLSEPLDSSQFTASIATTSSFKDDFSKDDMPHAFVANNLSGGLHASNSKSFLSNSTRDDTLNALRSMSVLGDGLLRGFSGSVKANEQPKLKMSSILSAQGFLDSSSSQSPKVWTEYPLDEKGIAFLKVDLNGLGALSEEEIIATLANCNIKIFNNK